MPSRKMNAPSDQTGERPPRVHEPQARERLAALWTSPPPATLVDPTGEGSAGSHECGSLITIQVRLDDDMVEAAGFRAYGCPETLASAAEAARQVEGRSLLEAALVSEAALIETLELPPDKWSRAAAAGDALHAALGQALLCSARTAADRGDPRGVLVGMSGGVDSTVAALLLREQGYRPVGATLKLWTDPESNTENSCCSGEAVQRARRVAHRLGIPHFTLNAVEAFFADVVQYFLAEYSAGRTPNPCAKCNARLRFGLLAEAAARLGLGKIATGHYARLTGDPPRLARGAYEPKDQSYVLSEIAPELLEHTLFPLGELDKLAVRTLAREAGLEGFDVPESQEICFVPQAGHRTFLRRHLGARPGVIVNAAGQPLGRHSGTYNFTIGQRRGHGVAAAEPLFVTHINPEKAEVVIGLHDELAVEELVLEGVTVHRPRVPTRGLVQTRSSGEPSPGVVAGPAGAEGSCSLANGRHATGNAMAEGNADEDQTAPGSSATDGIGATTDVTTAAADPDLSEPGRWLVRFDSPAFGIAPGQTAVLYDGDEVVLAGTIAETHAPTV